MDVTDEVVARLRTIASAFPEVREEAAWVGRRWQVRTRTFAHVLAVDGGWPPAYAKAVGDDGPISLLLFRSSGSELAVLRASPWPFFAPPWRQDEVGMVLGDDVDWTEVRELVTESYCVRAPAVLRSQVERPPG